MCPLAHILLDLGWRVSGSDLKESDCTKILVERGLKFYQRHDAENISQASVVVTSSAVPVGNPEIQSALARQIPVVRRAEFLARLLASKKVILVTGSHGKSSTTAMLAKVLRDCGLHPAYYVGGTARDLPAPGAWGTGEWAVVEADESDGTAACFAPEITILLNTEWEHVDYFKSPDEMAEFFLRVANSSRQAVIYSADDVPDEQRKKLTQKTISYGTIPGKTDVLVTLGNHDSACPQAGVRWLSGEQVNYVLSVPGRHQVLNSSAVLCAAKLLGCDLSIAANSVAEFRGVDRRMQLLSDALGVKIFSDYAHHPTEVKVTLRAAMAGHVGRTIAVFQPHRYSRSRTFAADYGPALAPAHAVFITNIYSAGEERPPDFSGENFADIVRHNGCTNVTYCHTRSSLRNNLWPMSAPGDQILIMGAGDIHSFALDTASHHKIAEQLTDLLKHRGRVTRMADMSCRTTIRLGGPAEFLVEPYDVNAAADVIKFTCSHSIPIMYLGRGSNLLVKDGGIRGVVLHLPREQFSDVKIEGEVIHAGAAIRLKELVHGAAQHNLGGLEFLEGIPGSLGGSLRMNAGAMGSWIFDVIESVQFLDKEGNLHNWPREKFNPEYRFVPELQNALVVSASLRAVPSSREQITEKLRKYSRKRWSSQPSAPSAGCFFKNPNWGPAGKLIDISNLKGLSEGGAAVSVVHGNFLVNQNHATASDMLRLMDKVKNTIREIHGIELENEVIIIGEDI